MIRNLNDTEEIWMHATTWMNLGDLMLREIHQAPKDKRDSAYMRHLI